MENTISKSFEEIWDDFCVEVVENIKLYGDGDAYKMAVENLKKELGEERYMELVRWNAKHF